ncbi:acyltransferase [Shewanella algae]|uniref:acyltransferase n=1 Tax=Shewanella algae TaxID=38313 RepID=UPI001FBB9A89|nr:acyltransferase [Shewanella algae]
MKKVIRVILKLLLRLFYSSRYLESSYFNDNFVGYRFALRSIWQRNILRLDHPLPFPAVAGCVIADPSRIYFHVDDLHNFQVRGGYFQNYDADILIGKGTYIAQNVGIITSNHNFYDLSKKESGENVIVGDRCWIGMNSVILPGVTIGDGTIVGAGSVVTKSFPNGNCIIAGNPAKIIKEL